MTVADLIRELRKLPADAKVMRMSREYNGAESPVIHVAYREKPGLGIHPNTVLIS